MLRADLHVHSIYSDGSLTIKEILDYAKSKKLDVISITDHNSAMGIEEAVAYGKEINIKVIPGIELSTEYNGEYVHVLGYFKDELPSEIKEFSKFQHEFRHNCIREVAQNIIDTYNLKIDFKRLMKQKGTIGRKHLINELILSNPECDKEYICNCCSSINIGWPGYIVSEKIETLEAIKFLKRNGAIVIIAHPVLLKTYILLDLLNENVDGLEAIYPANTQEDEKKFRKICQERNLIVTAGSDYHGIIDATHQDLAYNVLENEDLIKFLNKLEKSV